ncbi:hypothetical protein D5272_12565 [bacterium D16-76]|nr:hypothetical protein [bacterium D16-76]
MASISSLTGSSSTSSIYGNRNVISGLASGMDTEAMIENSIAGYKNKILSLQKQQVKTEWKQDAYRSIISKMVGLTQKYTSYTSATNLFSNSFFNRAVTTVANGKYASKVSATGKSASDIAITSIKSVASAARYAHGIEDLVSQASAAEKINWDDPVKESTVAGSINLVYGSNNLNLRFGEDDIFESTQELADSINKQLAEQTIKSSSGASKASEFLEAKVNADGRLVLEQKAGKDNKFYVSSASENLEKVMGGAIGEENAGRNVVIFGVSDKSMTKDVDILDHLQDRTMSFTLNGKTKTIQLGDTTPRDEDGNVKEGEEEDAVYKKFKEKYDAATTDEEKTAAYAELINARVEEQFGKGKIEVSVKDGALDIQAAKKLDSAGNDLNNYTLTVNTSAGRALGLGKNGIGNTLNTSWTLEDVLGKDFFKQTVDGKENYDGEQELIINGKSLGKFNKDTTIEHILTSINNNPDAGVNVSFSKLTNEFVFTARETGSDKGIEIGEGLGQKLFGTYETYDGTTETFQDVYSTYGKGRLKFQFDGINISFNVTGNETVKEISDHITSMLGGQAKASVNQYTGLIEVTDNSGNKMDFRVYNDEPGSPWDNDEFKIPDRKASYTPGTDTVFTAKINGTEKTMTRSTNVIDLDGLSVTFKGTFNEDGKGVEGVDDYEPITFTSTTDSDTIVDAIKSFVDDYNEMAKEIHDAYSTLPYKKSSGTFANYEPLVGDEADSYSESELKRYEEKAKQGLLFGDSTLRSLYQSLTGYIQGSGVDGATLRSIGIETAYEDGMTTIKLNETKLREALTADPDKVRDAFAKTTENGASTNGLMQNLKTTMDRYASTSIATPGILVQMAGTPLSSYSLQSNQLQTQMDNLETQIEKWTDKMTDRIDYYTNQFTRLEQLVNQMNSQSSALAGLMGG